MMKHRENPDLTVALQVSQGWEAAVETLRRAADAEPGWPTAATYVEGLDLLVNVDRRGVLLRGPLAGAVARMLEQDGRELEIEVNLTSLGALS